MAWKTQPNSSESLLCASLTPSLPKQTCIEHLLSVRPGGRTQSEADGVPASWSQEEGREEPSHELLACEGLWAEPQGMRWQEPPLRPSPELGSTGGTELGLGSQGWSFWSGCWWRKVFLFFQNAINRGFISFFQFCYFLAMRRHLAF